MADGTLTSGPVQQDLAIYQGDRYELFFRAYNLIWDTGLSKYVKGDYVVLTGTPKATIKAKRGGTEQVVATFDCTLGNQSTSPGSVLCVLTPASSELLTDAAYVYDVQISQDATHITTYLTGNIAVTKQVTSGA